jgi:hypothetical protein
MQHRLLLVGVLEAGLGEQGCRPERVACTLSVEGASSLFELLLHCGHLHSFDKFLPDTALLDLVTQIALGPLHIHEPWGRGYQLQLKCSAPSRTVRRSPTQQEVIHLAFIEKLAD